MQVFVRWLSLAVNRVAGLVDSKCPREFTYSGQKTLTADCPQSYCVGVEPANEEARHDSSRNVGLRWPDEDHPGQLAQALVPAVRTILLPVQGHDPLVDLLVLHLERTLDRLPAGQSCNRAASLLPQGVGPGMTA